MKNEEKRKKALMVYVIGGMMEKKNAKMPGIIANFFKNIREKRVSARIQRKHNVYLSAPCLFCYLNCFCNGIITGAGMYVGCLQGKKKKKSSSSDPISILSPRCQNQNQTSI